MSKYSKLTETYGSIWIAASGINAIISSMIIFPPWRYFDFSIVFLFIFTLVFSVVLSIPVLLVAMLTSHFFLLLKNWSNIFLLVLVVTAIAAVFGASYYKDFLSLFGNTDLLCLSIVVSAVSAVIMYHDQLKAINIPENDHSINNP